MTSIHFSVAARRDRREITAFTVERFGIQGARHLRDRFESVLNLLAESPEIGRLRPELDPPGHSFRYFVASKSFLVVYEEADDGVRVVRILHGARRLAEELENPPPDAD